MVVALEKGAQGLKPAFRSTYSGCCSLHHPQLGLVRNEGHSYASALAPLARGAAYLLMFVF